MPAPLDLPVEANMEASPAVEQAQNNTPNPSDATQKKEKTMIRAKSQSVICLPELASSSMSPSGSFETRGLAAQHRESESILMPIMWAACPYCTQPAGSMLRSRCPRILGYRYCSGWIDLGRKSVSAEANIYHQDAQQSNPAETIRYDIYSKLLILLYFIKKPIKDNSNV